MKFSYRTLGVCLRRPFSGSLGWVRVLPLVLLFLAGSACVKVGVNAPPGAPAVAPEETDHALTGQAAPGILPKPYGKKALPFEDLVGHSPCVIAFLSATSLPSRDAIPKLNTLYQQYKLRGLEVCGVFSQSGKGEMNRAMRAKGGVFPTYRDKRAEVAVAYQVPRYPCFFFLDASGTIKGVRYSVPENLDELPILP